VLDAPPQAPLQPLKLEPAVGYAVSVTVAPLRVGLTGSAARDPGRVLATSRCRCPPG